MAIIGIGIGAGLVSALLFAVVVTGQPLGILLYLVSPLPVLIAGTGWHHRAGLVAAGVGALAVGVAFRPAAGLAYAVASALPAWWLGYLALLGRPTDAAPAPLPFPGVSPRPPVMEWYPLGRLLLWLGLSAAIVTFGGALLLGGGDHDSYRATLERLLGNVLRLQTGTPRGGPLPTVGGVAGADLVRWLLGLAPAFETSALSVVLVVNLWLAGKVVALSGRLARPWPLLREARMEPLAAGLMVLSVALSFLPGYAGVGATALAGGIGTAFALQGLALLHDITLGRPGRGGMLGLVYVLALFFSASALPFLALAGFADTLTPIRSLAKRSGQPPGPGPTPLSKT